MHFKSYENVSYFYTVYSYEYIHILRCFVYVKYSQEYQFELFYSTELKLNSITDSVVNEKDSFRKPLKPITFMC